MYTNQSDQAPMPGAEAARSQIAAPLGVLATGVTAEDAVSASAADLQAELDAVLPRETARQALQLSMNRHW